ncbi:MAG: branched-chain amino acid transport system ATP-binding protein [Acidobacteriota bacterium]|jgi:branched-chain amino acid transport system ATP-binding protein|nr:branched-chain amino acid transport system ATP-binding protein [Acidobacteriota bacterium]
MTSVLELQEVTTRYGELVGIDCISLSVPEAACFPILGDNGAGKSTLLETVAGLSRPASGRILLDGRDITRIGVEDRVRLGIGIALEGRRLFADLTVVENLRAAVLLLPRARRPSAIEFAYEIFPQLRAKSRQAAGTLSGGEQQMLALARVLIRQPRLLLLDEPSLGLAPWLAAAILQRVWELTARKVTVIVAEPNTSVLPQAQLTGCLLYRGRIVDIAPVPYLLSLDSAAIQTKLQLDPLIDSHKDRCKNDESRNHHR